MVLKPYESIQVLNHSSTMAPNKDRVYIALYLCGGAPKMPGREDTYVTTIGLPYVVGGRGHSDDGLLMRTHD